MELDEATKAQLDDFLKDIVNQAIWESIFDALKKAANDEKKFKKLPAFIEEVTSGLKEEGCMIVLDEDFYFIEMVLVGKKDTPMAKMINILLGSKFAAAHLVSVDHYADKTVAKFDISSFGYNAAKLLAAGKTIGDSFPSFPQSPMKEKETEYIQYVHHDVQMIVRREDKGMHRQHCLCYTCKRFIPDSLNNCHKAEMIWENCIDLDVVTPVWECADFVEVIEKEKTA